LAADRPICRLFSLSDSSFALTSVFGPPF